MVRLLYLRHCCWADLRQALLPERRSAHRNARGFRHLFHWFCQSPHRGRDIRPLRRPHWPQRYADCHAAIDGYRDLPDCLCAPLRVDWHLGCRDFDAFAHGPRHRRRRGMGRFGASGNGVVASSRSARVSGVMAAIRCPGWSVPREPFNLGLQRFIRRSVRHLGLANSVRALDHTDRNWFVDSSRYP
jgi:hypothetical protein